MFIEQSAVAALGVGEAETARLNRALERTLGQFVPAPVAATAMLSTAAGTATPSLPCNVVGAGIGGKLVGGERLVPSIVVLVRRKIGPEGLPGDCLVPEEIDGFPTTVQETGDVFAEWTRRRRPVPCGVSVGNCTMSMAGTLGCFVAESGDPRRRYILSNNHVLALVNGSRPGTGIPQPGLIDGGKCDGDVVARLARYVPISFSGVNVVDAAIAELAEGIAVDPGMLRPGGRIEKLLQPHQGPALGAAVQKSGRTTGHTAGTITLVGVTVNVNMGTPAQPALARFDRQFQVAGTGMAFSQAGDSGSLVTLAAGNQPVGLLFAGGRGVTFCNEIGNVLSALDVSILY